MLSIIQADAFIKWTLVIKSWWCWSSSSIYLLMTGEFCHYTLEAIINSFNLVNSFDCTSFIGQVFCTSHYTGSVSSCTDDPISIPNVLPVVQLRRQMCTCVYALPETGMLSFMLQSYKVILAIRRRHWVLWWESRKYLEGLPEAIVGNKTWKLRFKLHKILRLTPDSSTPFFSPTLCLNYPQVCCSIC